jgi:hypothetical protein
MSIDIFQPATMIEALITNFPPHMFLTKMFFSDRKLHSTRAIDFDIQKGKRRLAPFVNRLHKGKVVEREDLKTKRFEPPYLKPKTVTTAEEIMKRGAGESVYVQDGSNAPEARAAKILAEDVTGLQMMVNRRIEWMAAQSLFTGKIPVKGEGCDYEIDLEYGSDQKKTLTGGAVWSATSTSDPVGDLVKWARQIKKLTGKVPRAAVLGRNAAVSVEKNEAFTKALNNLRTEAGLLGYKDLPEGAQYIGYIAKAGLELYTYDEWYVDDETGVEMEMVPENAVLVGASMARCRRHYGAIYDVEAGNFEVETFVKSWTEEDPSARFVLAQSAPITAIEEPEAFVVAIVQAAETP